MKGTTSSPDDNNTNMLLHYPSSLFFFSAPCLSFVHFFFTCYLPLLFATYFQLFVCSLAAKLCFVPTTALNTRHCFVEPPPSPHNQLTRWQTHSIVQSFSVQEPPTDTHCGGRQADDCALARFELALKQRRRSRLFSLWDAAKRVTAASIDRLASQYFCA